MESLLGIVLKVITRDYDSPTLPLLLSTLGILSHQRLFNPNAGTRLDGNHLCNGPGKLYQEYQKLKQELEFMEN
jgi:hypothetical protein